MRGFTARFDLSKHKKIFLSQEAYGFTLVELLVVMAVIAILSSVGLAVYSGVQKNARDAQRMANLATIRGALEQYRADKNLYPDALTGLSDSGYLNNVPDYDSYSCPSPCFNYEVCATLEAAPPSSCDTVSGNTCCFKAP